MGFSMQVLGMAAGAGSAYKNAKQQRGALRNEATINEGNAQVAEYQAEQAQRVGAAQEEASRMQTGQVFGKERAEMGAAGVDLGQGSATDVLAGTKVIGEHDALTIRDNAAYTAWGYRTQKTNYLNQAAMERAGAAGINPFMAGVDSALGSSGSVSSSWYSGQQNGAWYASGSRDSSGYMNFSWAGPGTI